MSWPEFRLKNLPEVLNFIDEAKGSTLGQRRGDARADSQESPRISQDRITEWARASGRHLEATAFAETLDGAQVESELNDIFRTTPEFGRSMALRLSDYHDEQTTGPRTLIGGGGEADHQLYPFDLIVARFAKS